MQVTHCQHHDSVLWLQRQLKALVPATYFLVTFTLPAQLRHLAWAHQRLVYGLMMEAAWATLKTFAQADKALGGTPGAVAVLHTPRPWVMGNKPCATWVAISTGA